MAGLVPFNRKNKELSTNTGSGDFYNLLDDFFQMIGHSDEHSLTTLLKWMSKIMARNTSLKLKCLVLIKRHQSST